MLGLLERLSVSLNFHLVFSAVSYSSFPAFTFQICVWTLFGDLIPWAPFSQHPILFHLLFLCVCIFSYWSKNATKDFFQLFSIPVLFLYYRYNWISGVSQDTVVSLICHFGEETSKNIHSKATPELRLISLVNPSYQAIHGYSLPRLLFSVPLLSFIS